MKFCHKGDWGEALNIVVALGPHVEAGGSCGNDRQARLSDTSMDGPKFDEKIKESSQKDSSDKDEQEAPPSRHLWVGNVSSTVTEAMLAEQFARFGDLENLMVYSARNYAFINFRNEEDAIYAKKGLQGAILGGLALRIEYAKGVKPCRHLWIGGICSSITKEQLEEELKAFGVVENLRFMRDYDSAFVDFLKTEDAIAVYAALNRRKLGKEELRVEYSKPQQEQKWDARYETQQQVSERMIQWDLQMLSGAKSFQVNGTKGASIRDKSKDDRDRDSRAVKDRDGEPSEVLWVGYPVYMKVDERCLRKAFSPFGEIERITTFPGRTYAFVQFSSIKAASQAKDALHGRLFNDPRVTISFARSEIGPVENKRGANNFSSSLSSPIKGHSSHAGISLNAGPYHSSDRYPGFYPFGVCYNGNTVDRIDNLEANIHRSYGTELKTGMASDLINVPRIASEHVHPSEVNCWNNVIAERDALLHGGPWPEVYWSNQEDSLNRELKRHKIGKEPVVDFPNEVRSNKLKTGKQPFDGLFSHSSSILGAVSDNLGSKSTVVSSLPEHRQHQRGFKQGLQEIDALTVVNTDISRAAYKAEWTASEVYLETTKNVWKWQGTIAKGGTPVCQARCSSVGKPVDITFPNVVNCTARTNLDMLAKHINQAVDFGVVFFLPYGDLDVGPYQEFMFYLTDKKRAAVCRLSDDATLFLVPPSEFVEQILKVHRGTHVFGVVLKLRQLHNQNSEVISEQIPAPHKFAQVQSSVMNSRYFNENQYLFIGQAPTENPFFDARMPKNPNVLSTAQPTDLPLTQELAVSLPSFLPMVPESDIVAATIPVQVVASVHANSVSSSIPSVGTVQGNLLFKNQTGPSHPSNHDLIQDARMSSQPQGWAPMQQEHQNPLLVNNFNITHSEKHSLKMEQSSSIQTQAVFPPLQVADVHGISCNAHFQQPRPPFLLPSMQVPPSDQQPPLALVASHQQQLQRDPGSVLHQCVNTQASSNAQHHFMPQNVQSSNISLSLESMLVHESQVSTLPTAPAITQGGSLAGAVETLNTQGPQSEQKQTVSQNQSTEDQKRFQATLQLAAALLEQLQQRKT